MARNVLSLALALVLWMKLHVLVGRLLLIFVFFPVKPGFELPVWICFQPPWLEATQTFFSLGLLLSNQCPPRNICAECPRTSRCCVNDVGQVSHCCSLASLKQQTFISLQLSNPCRFSIASAGTPATHRTHIFTSCLCSPPSPRFTLQHKLFRRRRRAAIRH